MYTPGWCRAGLREQAVEVDLGPERLSVFERAARNDFLFPAGFFEHLDVAEDLFLRGLALLYFALGVRLRQGFLLAVGLGVASPLFLSVVPGAQDLEARLHLGRE